MGRLDKTLRSGDAGVSWQSRTVVTFITVRHTKGEVIGQVGIAGVHLVDSLIKYLYYPR